MLHTRLCVKRDPPHSPGRQSSFSARRMILDLVDGLPSEPCDSQRRLRRLQTCPAKGVAPAAHITKKRKRAEEVTLAATSCGRFTSIRREKCWGGDIPTLIDGRRSRAATKAPMRKRLCRSLGVTHRSWCLSFCVRTQPGSGFLKGLRSSTLAGTCFCLVSNQGDEGMIGRILLVCLVQQSLRSPVF